MYGNDHIYWARKLILAQKRSKGMQNLFTYQKNLMNVLWLMRQRVKANHGPGISIGALCLLSHCNTLRGSIRHPNGLRWRNCSSIRLPTAMEVEAAEQGLGSNV